MYTRRFFELLHGLNMTVTPDPSDSGEGGGAGGGAGAAQGGTGAQGAAGGQGAAGAQGGAGDEDDEQLGEGGRKALVEERRLRRQLERRLQALDGMVSPEVLRQAQERADAAERELQQRAQQVELDRQRLESKYAPLLATEKAAREAAEKTAKETRINFLAKEFFGAAGGSDAVDEEGISAFSLFMKAKGQHFALEGEDKVYVVDAQGDPVLDKDGNYVDPKTWIEQVADKSPALAGLFKPRQGEGGGTRSSNGTRSTRGVDVHKLSQSELMDLAWSD